RLPDGLEDLAEHNLITFKSHREALDAWAIRELIAHYVAYRKLVSRSPSDLLPAEQFRLYAVAARFPHNLAGQVPWQQRQAGVYDCQWGYGHDSCHRGGGVGPRSAQCSAAPVQRLAGVGEFRWRRLPPALRGDEPAARAALWDAS